MQGNWALDTFEPWHRPMVDKNDGKSYARYIRGQRSTEQLLRQFLKLETGLGKNQAYARGHTFAFEWTQEQRDEVNKIMDAEGIPFEEAFDRVNSR